MNITSCHIPCVYVPELVPWEEFVDVLARARFRHGLSVKSIMRREKTVRVSRYSAAHSMWIFFCWHSMLARHASVIIIFFLRLLLLSLELFYSVLDNSLHMIVFRLLSLSSSLKLDSHVSHVVKNKKFVVLAYEHSQKSIIFKSSTFTINGFAKFEFEMSIVLWFVPTLCSHFQWIQCSHSICENRFDMNDFHIWYVFVCDGLNKIL